MKYFYFDYHLPFSEIFRIQIYTNFFKIQNIQSLNYFVYDRYTIFFIYFSLRVIFLKFKLNRNLTNDHHQNYSNILYIYDRIIPIIHEIIKLSRVFVFKYLTPHIFSKSYTLFSFRIVESFKN